MIEEAWEAVADCFIWHDDPTDMTQQWTANEKAVVAAFGLAVLEAVAEILDDGLQDGIHKPQITYLLSGIRDEINALGGQDGQEPSGEEG